ncbi:Calcium-binding EF-hand [Corchorus olitorius]|uniref:Calcium-binding EF-hand n=1 Tax=Corchorus olitorius TaxID=93759 RepID=A0A1R3L403_9ROSI|nr:Calcium-binding EF-hand [Corchorus olitorius]
MASSSGSSSHSYPSTSSYSSHSYAPSAPELPPSSSSSYYGGQPPQQQHQHHPPPQNYSYNQHGSPPSHSYYGQYQQQPSYGQTWFPEGTHPDVIRAFQAVDRDRSGFIDENELQQALSSGYQRFNIRTIRLLMFLFKNPQDPLRIG